MSKEFRSYGDFDSSYVMLSDSLPASALELGFSVHLAVEARVKLNDWLFVIELIAAIFL